jgi:hypothetical protein
VALGKGKRQILRVTPPPKPKEHLAPGIRPDGTLGPTHECDTDLDDVLC